MAPSLPPEAPAAPAAPVREQLERNLAIVARELARKAGASGVTMADVRIYAEQRGLLTGHEAGRSLSWLSSIPKKAGLRATGELRQSTRPKAHGNYQRVWILPEFAAA